MELGFETIGNATVIAYDGGPILATDPWLDGPAYFGSWILSHPIPAEQREAVDRCPYLWISHGHPDHLCHATLERMRTKEILLPDHVGGRIARELAADGFRVRVLPDGEWVQLSPRLRVLSVSDYYQDAALLMDLGGRLIADTNDAGDRGGGDLLRRVSANFDRSYLLALTGHGDADLINFFDEDGERLTPAAAAKEPLGPGINGLLDYFGLKSFVPFSSMHRYQRTDSAWANEFLTGLDEHTRDFDHDRGELLPPFAHVDFLRDEVYGLDPAPAPLELVEPAAFDDDWDEPLRAGELDRLRAYLARVQHWHRFLGWIAFRVGGETHRIDVNPEHAERGLTFELPRHSLMTAVEWRIFDDVLISNFAKCTLHGPWHASGTGAMYPDFNPFLTKFGDNGGAYSPAELQRYFRTYLDRGFVKLDGDPAAARYV